MTVAARMKAEVQECLRAAGRVLVPLVCAGCDTADAVLCPECAAHLGDVVRLEQHAPALRSEIAVWGAGAYEGPRRRIVLAWKTQGREDLRTPLADWTRSVGTYLAQLHGEHAFSGSRCPTQAPVWVVPAPSTWRRRLRGRPPVWHLADGVAQGLAQGGLPSAVVEALKQTGGGHGQRGKGSRQRALGSRRCQARLDLTGRNVVLVDDVLTTGATLQTCIDAVERAGGHVIGAVVLAGARVRGRS